MTGGPFTPEARSGVNVEEIMASATDPAMAIAGVEAATDTTTRRTPRVPREGSPIQFSLGVDSPMYGWRMTPDDLGQGQVQQIRTDQFVTPVAEQRFPYGAVAARQDAVSRRRAEIEAAKQKAAMEFDPFKGIGDPAAQHQYAFSNYLNKTAWPEMVQGVADGMGLTTEGAVSYLRDKPEGRLLLRQWAHNMDAIAKESVGMTGRAANLVAQAIELKIDIPKEEREALNDYMSATENGVPIPGTSPSDFLMKTRKFNESLSLLQFKNDFMKDFEKFFEMEFEAGAPVRQKGGRWEVEDVTLQKFDKYKDAMAERAAAGGIMGGDEKAIREWMDKMIQDRTEVKKTGWRDAYAGKGGGSGGGSKGARVVSAVRDTEAITNAMGDGVVGKGEYPVAILHDVTSGKGNVPLPRVFTDRGRDVTMIPIRVIEANGEKWIEGKGNYLRGERSTTSGSSSRGMLRAGDDDRDTPMTQQEFTSLPDIVVPYDDYNAGVIEGAFNVNAEQMDAILEEGRAKIRSRKGAPASKAAPSRITPEQFNAQWSKLKAGDMLTGPDGVTYIKQ